MNVSTIDLVILAAYMAAVVAFGMWVGRGARNLADYAVGGRDRSWWLILFSIVATETSTVTFLSIPGFAFGRDMTWLQLPMGFVVGRFVVGLVLLPHYFRGQMYTAYEVLHRRFGELTERAASVLFVVTRTLADGLRLFLTAIVLQEMTGLPMHWSVAAIGVATIAYTMIGGMRAVLWTDLVQFWVYIAGALVAFKILLARLPGGWDQMLEVGFAAGKLQVFDFRFDWSDPYVFWAGVVGGLFLTLGSHGVDQMMVQRYLCARRMEDARRALWVGGFVVLAQFALFLLIGVGLYCFYELFPIAEGFERDDRVFARFILDQLPVGVIGILLGAIFSAAMSTLSSSLNSCATATASDLVLPLRKGETTERGELRLTRGLTLAFGLAQIAVGIAAQQLTASVVSAVLGIAAFTTGIVLGVFALGIATKRVGQRAALVGISTGLVLMTWIFFATDLAWPWFALFGGGVTFLAGIVASRLPWSRSRVEVG